MYKRLFLALACTLAITSHSHAYYMDSQYTEGVCMPCLNDPYVTVGAGVVIPAQDSKVRGRSTTVLFFPTIPGTSVFDLPKVVWKNEYKTGFEVNAAAGFTLLPCWRAEAEFLYQNFKREVHGIYTWRETNAVTDILFDEQAGNRIRHGSSTTNVYCLLTNFIHDFKFCGPWSLSVGGGVGVSWLHSNRTTHKNVLSIHTTTPPLDITVPTLEKSPKLRGTAFAWQVKVGLNYEITPCFTVGLNYRLFGTTRFQGSKSSITSNPDTSVAGLFEVPLL